MVSVTRRMWVSNRLNGRDESVVGVHIKFPPQTLFLTLRNQTTL
jgi:hypothetical protein